MSHLVIFFIYEVFIFIRLWAVCSWCLYWGKLRLFHWFCRSNLWGIWWVAESYGSLNHSRVHSRVCTNHPKCNPGHSRFSSFWGGSIFVRLGEWRGGILSCGYYRHLRCSCLSLQSQTTLHLFDHTRVSLLPGALTNQFSIYSGRIETFCNPSEGPWFLVVVRDPNFFGEVTGQIHLHKCSNARFSSSLSSECRPSSGNLLVSIKFLLGIDIQSAFEQSHQNYSEFNCSSRVHLCVWNVDSL